MLMHRDHAVEVTPQQQTTGVELEQKFGSGVIVARLSPVLEFGKLRREIVDGFPFLARLTLMNVKVSGTVMQRETSKWRRHIRLRPVVRRAVRNAIIAEVLVNRMQREGL